MSGQKIIDGMKEAVAIAKGELACAGLFYNGFHYVRQEDYKAQADRIAKLEAALARARKYVASAQHSERATHEYCQEARDFLTELDAVLPKP